MPLKNSKSLFGVLESPASKYGYSNARVRGMKGLLLKSGIFDEMVRVGTVGAMIELLQRSGYKNDLASAGMTYSGSALIEIAASQNFARTVKKLLKIAPKSDRDALRALLIRWDLMNLKVLMQGRRAKQSYEQIRPHLVDVGGLSEEEFKRIIKADNSKLFREIRRTGLGQKMLSVTDSKMKEKLVNSLKSSEAFAQVEAILDGYIYLFMGSALGFGTKEATAIRTIINREIDAKNIMIIERLKKHHIPRDKILVSLIKGGTIDRGLFDKIIDAKDMVSITKLVKTKVPQFELKDTKNLTELEIAFEKSIAAQKVHAFHQATLSVGVIIGFLLIKEEEINNLRKIAKGKEFGLNESEVRAMLVVV